jgi:hypothetical protein
MLNLGLIGDIKLLEPYTQKAHENQAIHIIGKSSVGTQPKPGSFRLQAPEFNRIELIERSDALFINRFSLLPFGLLCEAIKKSKHIFAASYPNLSREEIGQLAKLANEAKTVIQFANPLYYYPGVQWMVNNLKKPAYIDLHYFRTEAPEKHTLLQLILMLKDFIGATPRKSGAVLFTSSAADSIFNNAQLDFGDGSVINLNFGTKPEPDFRIKIYMHNRFTRLDFNQKQFQVNNEPIDVSAFANADEVNSFINSILYKGKVATDIETYYNALQTVSVIQEKLDRYISH